MEKMGKTAGIIGWFGDGPRFAGGESDKVKSIKTLCQHLYTDLEMVTTDGWKRKPFAFFRSIKRMIKRSDDIFIVVSTGGTTHLLPIINWLNKHRRKRLYYVMVGIGTFKFETGKKNASLSDITSFVQNSSKWKSGNKIIKKNLCKMDCVFVETKTLKRMCETIYGLPKVVFLNNFRPLSDVHDAFVAKQYVNSSFVHLVFFARVCPAKGIDDLIAAFDQLPKDYQDRCDIDIYGMVQDFAEEWFKGLVLPTNMKYKGVILEDKAKVLAKYDCMIFPTHYIEGVPGTVIDCRFAGLPLICSNFTFASDLVSEGVDGFIYEYGNPNSLKTTLMKILDNPSLLTKLSENSYRRIDEFTEKTVLPIFQDALSRD